MPLVNLTAPEKLAANEGVESDLKWLLGSHDVDEDTQTALYHFKVKKMKMFAGMATDERDLRDVLKDQLNLDPATDFDDRLKVALIVIAWRAANTYVKKEEERTAEARSSHLPKEITTVDHKMMRTAFEALHGKLQKWEVPSKSYLGLKMEDIEDDEPKAEKLTEVHSKEDGEEQYLKADLDFAGGGTIKIKKGAQHGVMPTNGEELRQKLRVMCNMWLFLRTKHTNRKWLRDLTKDDFVAYSDYLLGKKVAALKDAKGNSPSFMLILNYEYEIRKQAYESVSADGFTLKDALKNACQDAELRNLHLIEPMMGAKFKSPEPKKRGDRGTSPPPSRRRAGTPMKGQKAKWQKGNKQGGKKGGGQGGGGGGGDDPDGGSNKKIKSKTPDGREICYKYNNKGEKCDGQCNRIHVCQICMGKHPRYECPSNQ
jgi:hypothetical protein